VEWVTLPIVEWVTLPIVEWVTQHDIAPNVVYKVLCYTGRKDLIELCFDKATIPRKWLDLEEQHARNYYYAVLPHRLSEPIFTRYFWKLIYAKWPSHFLNLDISESRQVNNVVVKVSSPPSPSSPQLCIDTQRLKIK
jgi:hypothetical protein